LKETCHFLALEDNANEAFFLEHAFGKAKRKTSVFVSRTTAGGKDYLNGVGEFADRAKYPLPDAILTDLHMPAENGLEFVAWLRAQPGFNQTRVFVLSGSSNPAEIQEASKRGANRVIMKPDQLQDLRALVEQLADEVCAELD
jgi:CheY-like chemotaxis protein